MNQIADVALFKKLLNLPQPIIEAEMSVFDADYESCVRALRRVGVCTITAHTLSLQGATDALRSRLATK